MKTNRFIAGAFVGLAGVLALTACGASGPSMPAQAATPANGSLAVITVAATDPCKLFTQAQVQAAFGKNVQSVASQSNDGVSSCTFSFGEENSLDVNFYTGDSAKQEFATYAAGVKDDCAAIGTIAFSSATSTPSAAVQALMSQSMGAVYLAQIDAFAQCMPFNKETSSFGSNVYAYESVLFSGSSTVAVIDGQRVVEVIYQEPIPDDVAQSMSSESTQQDSSSQADTYISQTLSGDTAILERLLQSVSSAS